MKYGLIGERLGHSFSKTIHDYLGSYEYELCEIKPEELDSFMKSKDFLGINVTIPYKEAVIPYLDEIDKVASEIGAVNTVVNRNGILYGYNTDFYGMKALFAHSGIEVKGCKAVILGSGGTSKTARAVLRQLGAKEIYRVSRSGRDGAITYSELREKHLDADVVVNTTPLGTYPEIFDMPLTMMNLKKPKGVIDAIYNPLRTMTVMEGRSYGAKAEGGLYMLVAQAVKASEIFLGADYPESITEEIYEKLLRQKENIVLIGMPSAGKSTVGRIVAQRLGRRFVDTDEEIERLTERSACDIIKDEGEAIFRQMEREVIEMLAKESSLVIATGGGAALSPRNVYALTLNGKIYFIDRPLDKLTPTKSRPLSSTKDDITKIYDERYPIYCNRCDVRIDANCSIEDVVNKILESYK